MVCAPASSPWSASVFRSSTISSSSSTAVCWGLLTGRLDRGRSPASPSATNRLTSSWTHRRDTPYSRATSACVRPSSLTAVTTSRASDIAHPPRLRCERCPETGVNYVVEPDTPSDTNHTYTAQIRLHPHLSLIGFVRQVQPHAPVEICL